MEAKCLIVLPPKDFNDQEYQDVREVLDAAGAIVKIATSAVEEAVGIASTHVPPDIGFEDVEVEDYDAIIFISGPGVFEYYNNARVLDLIRHFFTKGKLVAAISRSVEVLARAGVLAERRATIWKTDADALLSRNISYTGEEVTVDRNVITASGGTYAHRFAEKIVEYLKI
jgi:protease I